MKQLLQGKFLPSNYVLNQIGNCFQGEKSVTSYTKEFNQLSSRYGLLISEEQLVATYFGGLKNSIQGRVNHRHMFSCAEVYKQALRAEKFVIRAKAAIFIQARWRLHQARSVYLRQKRAALILQSLWRRREAMQKLQRLRNTIRTLKENNLSTVRLVPDPTTYFRQEEIHTSMFEPSRRLLHNFEDPFMRLKKDAKGSKFQFFGFLSPTIGRWEQQELRGNKFNIMCCEEKHDHMRLLHDGKWSTRRVLGASSHGYVIFDPGGYFIASCKRRFGKRKMWDHTFPEAEFASQGSVRSKNSRTSSF
jgi:hypothetical protein